MEDATISTAELKALIDAGAIDYLLVDTLKPESYAARHVPTAVNVPESEDFEKRFDAATHASKDARIIVYCSSPTCQRHIRAARALQEAGYSHVARYADGLAGWQAAGYDFAGE